jgi:Zn-dependent metalloprotease
MNKKHTLKFLTLGLFFSQLLNSQSNQRLSAISKDFMVNDKNEIDLIRLDKTTSVYETNAEAFLNNTILTNGIRVSKLRSETDKLGFNHTRYQLTYNNIPVHNAQVIAHCKDGKIVSVNGYLSDINKPSNSISLTEKKALELALKKVNAKKYKWENKAEEQHLRKVYNQPNFTYYPKGELVIYSKENGTNLYAYKFAIFADEPLYGSNVFVDANNGSILAEENQICTVDVPATANTKYSGVNTMMTDSTGPGAYRLRETGRGGGIETYNLSNSTTYTNTDFTNTTTIWPTTAPVQVGTDAHWGAEMTYDYYWLKHSRNSIDNLGFKLLSYVHYGTNYNNAFWNGSYMTYGDGDGSSFYIFTALDVCGHEITHGVVSKTANLGSGEAGALNEAFADIFGTTIENFARPSNWNWKIGSDITPGGVGLRDMSNPKSLGQPDTYKGINWDAGGEVHQNNGPCIYWYYLLCMGGTGVNDNASSYTVTGLTMPTAADIAYRGLTTYFVPTTSYATARNYCKQAAIDLHGACSNEVYQTENAWYAVGVGGVPAGTMTPTADFTSTSSLNCSLPFTANFANISVAADSYLWDFGDGSSVSTSTNPVHTYTSNGTYNVKLKASSSCASSSDSITKNAYIVLNAPPTATTTNDSRCGSGTVNLVANATGQAYWYTSSSATGTPVFIGNPYTPTLSTTTSYYVVNTFTNASVFGGPASPTIGTGANYPGNTAYDSLTVIQPCILKSVMVQAASTATRTIQLRSNTNAVLQSTVVNIPAGTSTVAVNFTLTPGYGYRLGLGTGPASLYRNNGGVSYPYNIGGLVKLTGSSQGPSYHFYFYNLELQPGDCRSGIASVTGTILPGSNMTVNSTTICSGQSASLTASGSTTYTWSTGANTSSIVITPSVTTVYTVSANTASCGTIVKTPTVTVNTTPVVSMSIATNVSCTNDSLVALTGSPSGGIFTGTSVSGNNFNPSIGVGTYTVTYNYLDPINGCYASAAKSITVSACTGIHELNNSAYIKLYPNPANDYLMLTSEKETDLTFKIYDATGKILIVKQLSGRSNRIDINTLAKGIYFIEAQDNSKNTYRQKIVKQ